MSKIEKNFDIDLLCKVGSSFNQVEIKKLAELVKIQSELIDLQEKTIECHKKIAAIIGKKSDSNDDGFF